MPPFNALRSALRAHGYPSIQHHRTRFLSPPVRILRATYVTKSQSVLLAKPSSEDLEEAGVEPTVAEQATLEITDRAAEHLRNIATEDSDPDVALRIAVESGGCHGYQYKIELTSRRQPDDFQFTHPSLRPSNIVVDAVSLNLLKGSTIDFATELIGSSFRIVDNPQAKGSGCGCGVSWEAKF
ncbi:hypothetical protein SISNIDRAFT_442203 [Sistotremastrum niveocremeum HHB9708]|uniref:Core domain-containing protein n=1 Tax=Sistotremastrum niveocremeum HHB9708 TaxID=1314777 RepID=A0A164TK52_9AGAM|nr:hypothetical protein SISNIDRAFT_442203 [Sistotremastrum niveocremeum HHB9708]